LSADASLISVTAKVAAYYRQFSDIPFAAEVAKRVGADEAFERILREHGLERDKLTFYAPMFEARYKSITQVILQSGASQVLELASGYSLRGLDLTRHHQLWYVETDLPERVRLREAIMGVTQRQVDASAFEDDRDLAAFLNRTGFHGQVRSQVDETPSFSSIQSLGLSPALIERLRAVLRLWVMTSGDRPLSRPGASGNP
jgi:O-methyltransferase involved in polyketide biosynthesis